MVGTPFITIISRLANSLGPPNQWIAHRLGGPQTQVQTPLGTQSNISFEVPDFIRGTKGTLHSPPNPLREETCFTGLETGCKPDLFTMGLHVLVL